LRHLLVSLVLAVVIFVAYLFAFETPADKVLIEENKRMAEDLQQINDSLERFNEHLNALAYKDNEVFRVIFELDSIPEKLRNSGFGGADLYSTYSGHQYSEIVIDIRQTLDQLNKKLDVQENSFLELTETLEEEAMRMRCTPAITPIHNDDLTRYGTDFGLRRNPVTGHPHFHKGVDHTAPTGTPIYASGDGVITFANYRPNGYGKYVTIDHGVDGLSTLYAHMNSICVRKGEKVVRGQQIGTVGSTGLSLGPHLHYEVHMNGRPVSPIDYQIRLTSVQYNELLLNANEHLASVE
jgi:murein DD-endopeptidase MepM/ murein hydrolase activator NlpD